MLGFYKECENVSNNFSLRSLETNENITHRTSDPHLYRGEMDFAKSVKQNSNEFELRSLNINLRPIGLLTNSLYKINISHKMKDL